MKAITLRGLDEVTYQTIKKLSNKTHISMNKFILNLVKNKVGTAHNKTYKELDKFFGTWSKKEYEIFIQNHKSLRKIDKKFWN